MKILTANTIERYSPCRTKLVKFKAEWPKGMPITRKSLNRAFILGIRIPDWEWFIGQSFPKRLARMYFKDAEAFAIEVAYDMLHWTEYDALRLEWVYYYLLGIDESQLIA